MDRIARSVRMKRLLLSLIVICNVLVLAFYKYTGFILSSIDDALGLQICIPAIALPLGISYFTLKLITYAVDVYRRKAPALTNYVDLTVYVAMFPAITAGPVVKFETVASQLRERTHSLSKLASGMRLFCIGLAKKVLVSNNVALLASELLAQGGRENRFSWRLDGTCCFFTSTLLRLQRLLGHGYWPC